MDMTQPAREPVTYHADSHGGFYTTSLFWNCSCNEFYVHPFTQPDCPACRDRREEAPEARVNEVLRNAYEWRLDKELVHQLEEIFPYCDLEMEPDEGLLVEQHENASRMQDDGGKEHRGLAAAYEDRISGWNDDF